MSLHLFHRSNYGLLCILWATCMRLTACNGRGVCIATYNLWNVMFNWEVRQLRIAQIIKEIDPDIIAFQEARGHEDQTGNQVAEMGALLPQYRWHSYRSIMAVSAVKGSYVTGYELEGIGLLSKLPIIHTEVQNLTYNYGPDTNRRIALHVLLQSSTMGQIHVVVVHFSYDRQQQCSNAADILHFIEDKVFTKNVIILGDFNSYRDFEYAVSLLLDPDKKSKCSQYLRRSQLQKHFLDSWTASNPEQNGLTFSNMPHPGLESRPDRILVSSSFHVTAGQLKGNGGEYKKRFFVHIIWQRMENFVRAAYDSHQGVKGRSCAYDCGPHASCRCGLCVGIGDEQACDLPTCEECGPSVFKWILFWCVIVFLLVSQLIYAVLIFFKAMNKRGGLSGPDSALVKCCVFDPAMYTHFDRHSYRRRHHIVFKLWPILKLPPMLLIIVTILMGAVIREIIHYVFTDAIRDVWNVIPEELYPSDHLLLAVQTVQQQSNNS